MRRRISPELLKALLQDLDDLLPAKESFRSKLFDKYDPPTYYKWLKPRDRCVRFDHLAHAYQRAVQLNLIDPHIGRLAERTFRTAQLAYDALTLAVEQFPWMFHEGLDCGLTYLLCWDSAGCAQFPLIRIAAPHSRCADLGQRASGRRIPFDHQTGYAREDPAWLRIYGQDLLVSIIKDCEVENVKAPLVVTFRDFRPNISLQRSLPGVHAHATLQRVLEALTNSEPVEGCPVYYELQWFIVALLYPMGVPVRCLVTNSRNVPYTFHAELVAERWFEQQCRCEK